MANGFDTLTILTMMMASGMLAILVAGCWDGCLNVVFQTETILWERTTVENMFAVLSPESRGLTSACKVPLLWSVSFLTDDSPPPSLLSQQENIFCHRLLLHS